MNLQQKKRYPTLSKLVSAQSAKAEGGLCRLCAERPAQISDKVQLCPDCAENIGFVSELGLGLDYASAKVLATKD